MITFFPSLMSDGLSKLTAYLNQTRRQAELTIDGLNDQIGALSAENKSLKLSLSIAESERDYFKNYVDQLKLENSKKWRLQERDDWKSLVESVQKDRTRLQEECLFLQTSLEIANAQISKLEKELQSVSGRGVVDSNIEEKVPSFADEAVGVCADSDNSQHSAFTESVLHPDPTSFSSNPSYTAPSIKLRLELEKVQSQVCIQSAFLLLFQF